MRKFIYAFKGLYASLCDRSVQIQILLAICTLIAGIVYQLTYIEWLVVIVCIGMVIASEIVNSCIERLCDLYSKEENKEIATIKDMAASSVLVVALTSFIIAIMIIIQHIH